MSKIFKTPEHIKEVILKNNKKESFYIYDLEVMRYKMKLLSLLPENVKTYYAMKVNPHLEVVKEALKNENISWIEVASKWEIDVVMQAWEKDLSRVIYTWPSKKDYELECSVENNIKYLNVESLKEAVVINQKAKEKGVIQPILMRLNTKHKFEESEAWVTLWSWDTQFGFPQDKTEEYLKKLEKLENIKVEGFHMYPATWIMKAEVLLRSVDETFKFVKEIEAKTNKNFETIDFWWGFWIDYGGFEEFDIKKYSQGLNKLIEKYNMEDKTLILELWRFLWADMWYFVTKVNDIKTLASWKKAVLCTAWTNALKRPQVLWVDYHIDIVKNSEDSNLEIKKILEELWDNLEVKKEDKFNVYWPFCTSVDKILWDKTGKEINLGDFIVIPQTWAYWKTMSPQDFLSHPEVEEVILN